MATFVNDTFTDATSTLLQNHTGETGATWTQNGSSAVPNLMISDANRVRAAGTTAATNYFASGVPATADYDVTLDLLWKSTSIESDGVLGRSSTAAQTFYAALYRTSSTAFLLRRYSAGAVTELGSFAAIVAAGTSHNVLLQMRGTALAMVIDGTTRVTATDTSITAAAFAGVRWAAGAVGNTVGLHGDNFKAIDAAIAANVIPSVPRVFVGQSVNRLALFSVANSASRS